VRLTQEDLAGLAGTSRATVNRTLRELQDAGVLTLRRGSVDVGDLEALAARAG
jgi:CRP-like cAMP-binding protein